MNLRKRQKILRIKRKDQLTDKIRDVKLLFTLPCLAPHGGIHNVLEVANQFADRGHDVTVYDQSGNVAANVVPDSLQDNGQADYLL